MSRVRLFAAAVTLAAAVCLSPPSHAAGASDFVAKWDPDKDKTLDLAEINKAAAGEFDKLDVDHDGTLELKELGKRVTKAEFAAADPDKDGTLTKTEYETIVAKRFTAANPDGDTTIEVAELKTKNGQHLLLLLK